ncbi:GNAT family N-acetyltransferase [Clostridium neuense]|uniref:GNAT family N-acetyltransferase n=1 Tax=Clostridium neuense TaxID=1728934 RepID=A0ABW8TM28_9CLOT
MLKGKNIIIEKANGLKSEYIISDKFGITIGRIFIVDLNNVSKFCCIRIKLYRQGESIFKSIREILKMFLDFLFNSKEFNKVSVLVDEEITTRPFVDLGFQLEGIVSKSIVEKNVYKDELIFGIDYKVYNDNQRINILRLSGKDINVKVLTPNDATCMLDYYIRNREHLRLFEPSREESFYTFEMQKQILMEGYKQYLNGEGINFGIYVENSLIGKIQVSNITYGVFKSAIIGYSMDQKYQGRGWMKQALSLVLNYAFNEMELHRIEASTLVDNIKSQKVLLGCGFEKLGLNRNYLYINGEWRDHITFYKIKNSML